MFCFLPQTVAAYDEDAALSVSALLDLKTCNGRVGATGMCLGGHLAYRCALDGRVGAAVCYFATDVHSRGLGKGKRDDSLERAGDIRGELVMVWFATRCLVFGDGRAMLMEGGCASRSLARVSPEGTGRVERGMANREQRTTMCLLKVAT